MMIEVIGMQGLIVNEDGECFCDESPGRHVFGGQLFRQGRVTGLMIVDSAINKDAKAGAGVPGRYAGRSGQESARQPRTGRNRERVNKAVDDKRWPS